MIYQLRFIDVETRRLIGDGTIDCDESKLRGMKIELVASDVELVYFLDAPKGDGGESGIRRTRRFEKGGE